MQRAEEGLWEDRPQFNMAKYFNVIDKEPSIRDRGINEDIEKSECHCKLGGGCREQPLTGGEAEWYMAHKGYSKDISESKGASELPA